MNRAALDAAFRLATRLPSTVHRSAAFPGPEPEREYRRTPPAHFARDSKRCPNGEAGVRTIGGEQVKWCTGCKCDHNVAAFNKGSGPSGLHRHCRDWQARWRQQAKDKKA